MTHLEDACVSAADEAIARAEATLKDCCLHMDSCHRPMVARWLTAAEGIRLWNHAGHAVSGGIKDAALAAGLERWLLRYEAMWREVSRESELWRIRDVTVWYANELR